MAAASRAGHAESILNAQVAVMPFYAAHGFQAEGEVFDECGIPHQRMRALLKPAKSFVPHLTVAAVIEQEGRFMLVEELVHGRPVLNQPAGHVEAHETLLDAVVREVSEETGYRFVPEAILGLYEWPRPDGETYLRVAFRGRVEGLPRTEIDPDILRTVWLDAAAMTSAGAAEPSRLRSGLVLQCLVDYQAGCSLPLDTVRTWRGPT
jgi:8-oxo-dGTP pyrophosphatase MutT (NUDIX family)